MNVGIVKRVIGPVVDVQFSGGHLPEIHNAIDVLLEDRKIVLENVMKAAEGKLTVIAHVACNNTKDSMELARKQFRNVLHMQKLTICCLMKKAVMK